MSGDRPPRISSRTVRLEALRPTEGRRPRTPEGGGPTRPQVDDGSIKGETLTRPLIAPDWMCSTNSEPSAPGIRVEASCLSVEMQCAS